MRAPYTQLYLHCVWATWDRLPLITPQIEAPLYAAIDAKCHELNCEVLAIGGVQDHIHLLVRFPATLAVAVLLKEIKGATSHLMTHQITPDQFFKWQGAYGVFTVSKDALDSVCAYVSNQKTHHAAKNLIADWEKSEIEESSE